MHFLDEIDARSNEALSISPRAQAEHGGWPLYQAAISISAARSKAYYALKLPETSDAPTGTGAPAMQRGGAASVNVFTRIALALFAPIARARALIPVEIMLLPRWFPFHLDKSPIGRARSCVPLFHFVYPQARRQSEYTSARLFTTPPGRNGTISGARDSGQGILAADRRAADRSPDSGAACASMPPAWRKPGRWRGSTAKTLGAIFPAMVNALEANGDTGLSGSDRGALQRNAHCKSSWSKAHRGLLQPCVSPVWTRALASLAMQGRDAAASRPRSGRSIGSGSASFSTNPETAGESPGIARRRWAFSSRIATTRISMTRPWSRGPCIRRAIRTAYAESVRRALIGSECRQGRGFAAFDADKLLLPQHDPFADHGALLDPPTSDVTRGGTVLAARPPHDKQALDRAIGLSAPAAGIDGSWFGRWGTNYIRHVGVDGPRAGESRHD